MVTKAELFLNILLELERSNADILTSAIVTLDGLTMASTAKDTISKEAFAAYSAAFKRADESMEELSDENVNLLVFESENQRVFSIGNNISELCKVAGKIKELLK